MTISTLIAGFVLLLAALPVRAGICADINHLAERRYKVANYIDEHSDNGKLRKNEITKVAQEARVLVPPAKVPGSVPAKEFKGSNQQRVRALGKQILAGLEALGGLKEENDWDEDIKIIVRLVEVTGKIVGQCDNIASMRKWRCTLDLNVDMPFRADPPCGVPKPLATKAQPIGLSAIVLAVFALSTGFTPAAHAQSVDLVAIGLEVTQGIQDLNNSVRLVAQKRTFVRFYVRTSQGTATTTAVLTVRRGDNSVTLAPRSSGGTIQVVSNPDRAIRDHAFLFELPDGYRQGAVSLRAEVNPGADTRSPQETDYTNNVANLDVRFEDVPPLSLVIYSIGYTDDNGNFIINDEKHARMMVNWIARSWPVNSVRFWLGREDITRSLGRGLPDCERVNAFLTAKRLEDLQNPNNKIPANARYYGMVDDRGGFMRGCADGLPGFTSSGPTGLSGEGTAFAWDTDGSFGDWYGAHEVAHNFMRYHAEFCGATGGDKYPYPEGHISPSLTGADAVMGFDIGTLAVYGANWTDNMTYCNFQWTGKFSYHGLMDALQQNVAPVTAALRNTEAAARRAASVQDRLLVVGSVDITKPPAVVKMSPFYILKDAVEVQARQAGGYAIVLNKGDQELANYSFTPSQMSSGPGKDPNAPELSLLAIQELVPYVEGTTRVDIVGPGKALLYSVKAGAAFPTVQIKSPAGGETLDGDAIDVSWTASDPDGDPLAFTVQFSADGGQNWYTVEQNVRDQTAHIDRIDLSGSATAMFRVLATDGIHTTVANSKPFTLAGRSPIVEIASPAADEAFVVGETVTLTAFAYDADNGEVADENIAWTSSIDGPLGTGLELHVTKLSAGSHTITVSVKDDAGLPPVSAMTQVTVVARAADLPVIADKLVVEPEVILLNAVSGPSSEGIEILNRNSRKALTWTAAGDRPWMRLDTTSGSTPALVTVSLGDLSTVNAGTQIGSVTITSSDGQKAVVHVQAQK